MRVVGGRGSIRGGGEGLRRGVKLLVGEGSRELGSERSGLLYSDLESESSIS